MKLHPAVVELVVTDLPATLAFYRLLGLDLPAEADNESHVEVEFGGLRLAFDTTDTVRSFDPNWTPPTGGHRVALAFECETPAEVDAAWDEIKHWTIDDHNRIRAEVPKLGLAAKGPRGRTFQQLGREILEIAHKGLAARKRLNGSGDDETGFLDPLREVVRSGKVPAEILLEKYHGAWGGDVSKVYDELTF